MRDALLREGRRAVPAWVPSVPFQVPGRPLAALLGLLAFLTLSAAPAIARGGGGSIKIQDLQPVEADGRWKLQMTLNFGSVPQMPHIPMLFSFTPTALYERALLDKTGDKPQLNRIPLVNQQGIHESLDVGFSDASGKVFPITKFDFIVRRDRGYEAGEYDLKVTREGDGVQVGSIQHLTLKGDNPVVDRRAIVFSGETKKKKPDGDSGAAKDEKKKDEAPATAEAAGPKDEKKDEAPEGEAAAAPPPVPPKQGGCGCLVAGEAGSSAAGVALVAGLAAAVARRRRPRA